MKRLLFLSMFLLSLSVNAEVINDINYTLDSSNNTAAVRSKTQGYFGDVVIPSEIEYEGVKYTVVSIGTNAFMSSVNLTSVTLPNSIKEIGYQSFYGCVGIKEFAIPNSVEIIGYKAFQGCSSLEEISIPSNVTTINSMAFADCVSLKKVYYSANLETIWTTVFGGCNNIKEVSMGCEIVPPLFSGLSSLENVTFDKNVTTIGEGAFRYCNKLSRISFTNNITSIGRWAFLGCKGLENLTLPMSMTHIGDEAFSGCTGLTKITVLCSLESCGTNIFENCNNIKEVLVDCEKITPIFRNVSSIKNITLSENVSSIGMQAFSGCSGFTSLKLPSKLTSIESQAFEGCSGFRSLVIPNSVTYIGWGAFRGCGNLSSVIIGSGVTTIDGEAFNSSTIKKMIWLTNTPPSGYYYTGAAINYVSNNQYNSLSTPIIYPFLSSYFEKDGIIYVPVSPSERTCDAIDCIYEPSSELTTISPIVTYQGITMNVLNVQPYICYNNIHIKNLRYEMEGEIPEYAFSGCENIAKIHLGNQNKENNIDGCYIGSKISKIGDYSFYDCHFQNLIIEDREDELILGSNGSSPIFSTCPIDSVYIGGNITYQTNSSFGYSPFYRNTSLRVVVITDKETEISENEFYGCTNLQNFTIGDGVSMFGDYAFSGCSSLEELSFGSKLQSIGKEAFSDCYLVTKIESKAIVPPVCDTQALDDISKWTCKLFVPKGCMSSYQQAEQWKEFFFIEENEDDPSGISKNTIEKDKRREIYDINGIRSSHLKNGINIVRLSGGRIIKVVSNRQISNH